MPIVVEKRANARVQPRADGDPHGSFDMILSNGTKDRDGETLNPDMWVQPLPDTIPINANHSADVSHIVGSGTPHIDDKGNLRVRGTYASTPLGQHIRTLVNENHLRTVSVEFLRRKDGNGDAVNELVGGAFVNIPANPEARVLASKTATDPMGWLDEMFASKAATEMPSHDDLIQAVHDASVHLGADTNRTDDPVAGLLTLVGQLANAKPTEVPGIADQIVAAGVALGGTAPDPASEDPAVDDGADEGANSDKATALRLRIKMLQR